MWIRKSVTSMHRSRMLKLVATLGAAATIASLGIGACHDTLPVEPVPVAPPRASLSTAPTEAQLAEMPSEFRESTDIIEFWLDVGFIGDQAYGSAYMKYLANYATITLPLTLLYNNREVTSTTGFAERSNYLPAIRDLNAVASLGVNGSCGHMINASAAFYVHNQFLLNKSWLVWGKLSKSAHRSKSQPQCSCTSSLQMQSPDYDPYSKDQTNAECESGDDGSNGGEAGSGTQYQPGDYTGGETVSWTTGVGNGGGSLCGDDAMVEYICIDTWNGDTQQWDRWSCGYATTCGNTT